MFERQHLLSLKTYDIGILTKWLAQLFSDCEGLLAPAMPSAGTRKPEKLKRAGVECLTISRSDIGRTIKVVREHLPK